MPKDLPPKSTAHFYFMLWDCGTLERIHEALYVAVREAGLREASFSAAIIASQSAKAAQIGAYRSIRRGLTQERGSRAASAASLLKCSNDGVSDLLRDGRRRFPFIERIFADAGYRGVENGDDGRRCGTRWKIEIVKPLRDIHRFVILPKRRIVERTFAWISRNRRLARDFERYATTVAAFIRLAMIRLMLKRLTRPSH
jgi:transposase